MENLLEEARKIIKNSFDTRKYTPENVAEWHKAYETFKTILD